MASTAPLGARLYRGETSVDIVGRIRTWLLVTAAIVAVSLLAVVLRGLNLGIEFRGGAEFDASVGQLSADQAVAEVREAVTGTGIDAASAPIVTIVGSGGDQRVSVETGDLTTAQSAAVRDAVAEAVGTPREEVTTQVVGPSWGEEITRKALYGLLAFLVLITVYLSLAFEPKMALSAIVALLHDLIATVGIYALVGFDVTPATVIGLLTILGYSLYDTVVVFDKVRENTKGIGGQSTRTYTEAANLALNQTLVRSLVTSLIALLPIAAILFVGAGLLGAGTLKDFALVLFIGVAVGTFSSVFLATPLLAYLKEREPAMRGLAARVAARRSGRAARPRPGTAVGPVPTGGGRPSKRRPIGASVATAGPPAQASSAVPAVAAAPRAAQKGAAQTRGARTGTTKARATKPPGATALSAEPAATSSAPDPGPTATAAVPDDAPPGATAAPPPGATAAAPLASAAAPPDSPPGTAADGQRSTPRPAAPSGSRAQPQRSTRSQRRGGSPRGRR